MAISSYGSENFQASPCSLENCQLPDKIYLQPVKGIQELVKPDASNIEKNERDAPHHDNSIISHKEPGIRIRLRLSRMGPL